MQNEIKKNVRSIFCYSSTCITRWTKPVGSVKRPRIWPGTVKSLNAPWELSQLALRRDYAKKIDPCRMLVWLGRRTVPQDRVSTRCYLASRYKLGRSCSNSNLLRPRVIHYIFTCVLKQASEKPRRKLVKMARYLLDSKQ